MSDTPIRTFVISKGYRITASVIFAIYGPFGIFLPIHQWIKFHEISGTTFMALLGSFFSLFATFLLVNAFKCRFEFFTDRIRVIDFFRTREFSDQDIQGFRRPFKDPKSSFYLILQDGTNAGRIYNFYNDSKEFDQFIVNRYTNLSQIEEDKEKKNIMSDTNLGENPQERLEKLTKIKKFALPFFIGTIVYAYWGMIFATPYLLFVWVSIVLPVIGALLGIFFPSIVRIDAPARSPYVNIAVLIIMPAILLAFRAFMDWHILQWDHFWLPFVLLLTVLAALLHQGGKTINPRSFLIMALIYCGAYGYGATIILNCVLDPSEPAHYPTKIISKEMHTGRLPEYFFTVAPWGNETQIKRYRVAGYIYNSKKEGDDVVMAVKEGLFHIPYYRVQ